MPARSSKRGRARASARTTAWHATGSRRAMYWRRTKGTLMNLADCSERIGDLVASWRYWQLSIELLQGDDRLDFAKERVASLERRLPLLTVQIVGDLPEATSVTHNGAAIDPRELGKAVPVNPGQHTLESSAPNRVPWARRPSISVKATRKSSRSRSAPSCRASKRRRLRRRSPQSGCRSRLPMKQRPCSSPAASS